MNNISSGNANQTEIDLKSFKKPLFLHRKWVVFFCVTACFIMFLLRYNLSLGIFEMLDEKDYTRIFNKNQTINDTEHTTSSTYQFSNFMVDQMLLSYFYGYTLFQIPAGRLIDHFGARLLLGYGTFLSGLLAFLCPFSIDLSAIALIFCRLLTGMLHSTILACTYAFFVEWLPKEKRTNAITLTNIGYELGSVCSFMLTGSVSSSYLGWRYSFYLFALIAFIWTIPYFYLIYSKPEDDPNLSDYEKHLIEKGKMIEYSRQNESNEMIKIPAKLDWKIILTSKPVIASCCAKFAFGAGYNVITTNILQYFLDVYFVLLNSDNAFTALTILFILLSRLICLKLSNCLENSNLMSLTNLRKTFQTIAMLIPAFSLLVMTLKDSVLLSILMIFLSLFGLGFASLGDTPITIEFARDLPATIFSFTNTFGCIGSLLCSILVSLFRNNFDNKLLAWNCIFYVIIAIYVICALVFVLFSSAELQGWAECKFVKIDELKENNESEIQLLNLNFKNI